MSRLHRVVSAPIGGWVTVEDVEGDEHRVSLLAFEGSQPGPGDWLVVHSGYALQSVDPAEASAITNELRAAQTVER